MENHVTLLCIGDEDEEEDFKIYEELDFGFDANNNIVQNENDCITLNISDGCLKRRNGDYCDFKKMTKRDRSVDKFHSLNEELSKAIAKRANFKLPQVPSMFVRKKDRSKDRGKARHGAGSGSNRKEEDRISNESGSSTHEANIDVDRLSPDELREIGAAVLKEYNVSDISSFDIEKLKTILRMHKDKLVKSKSTCSAKRQVQMLSGLLTSGSENLLSHKEDIATLKVALAGATVSYVQEFATTVLPDTSHRFNGLQLLGKVILKTLTYANGLSKHAKSQEEHLLSVEREKECLSQVQDLIKCMRSVMNFHLGIVLALREESNAVLTLLETLTLVNNRAQNDSTMAVRRDAFELLAAVAFIDYNSFDDPVEITGAARIITDLGVLAARNGQPRFSPLTGCLEFCAVFKEHQMMARWLNMMNMIINISSFDSGNDDMSWQMRMRLRSELHRDGMGKYLRQIEHVAKDSEIVRSSYEAFLRNKETDFSELHNRFEGIKGEYDTLEGCFELLASSVENTPVESFVLNIMQHLLLIPDDFAVRLAYFRVIGNCISEIVFHKHDPDAKSMFSFQTPIAEMIDALQDSEVSKKLEQAVQAKQEAVAVQLQYWNKLNEFRTEADLLRKHIADKSAPLPPPTVCNLRQPCSSSPGPSSGLPPVTGGPPPPPAPGGLPPVTGGPPPPPPPGGLPRVTGGPPPPPPPGGGPPAPPPPPNFGGPPAPPPPPMLGKGPPGAPPPPLNLAAMAPPIPDYLPPKKKRNVEVPMRKFPWGSSSINPRDLPRDCFWAQTKEEKLASDALFNTMKARFATAKPGVKSDDAKSTMTLRKAKQPQIIQDEKVLKSLAILQGSKKLSHEQWRRGILELDDHLVSANHLQQLRDALPPLDILRKFADVDEMTLKEMPEGELFVASLAKINALPLRLDLLIFRLRFQEILGEVKSSLSSVIEACDEVRRSKGFKVFLELALLLGNFMGQSAKSHKDVFGFEMSVLPKIVDTKDVENSQTLLHYMIEAMKKIDSSKARFAQEDFFHCSTAARTNADEIQKGVASVRMNVTKLENCLKTYQKQGSKDRFVDIMTPFLDKAQSELSIVQTMHEKMTSDWKSLAKYYAFDTKKYPMEQFFSDLKAFKEQYESAYRDLEQKELQANQAKNAKAEKKKRPPLGAIQSQGTVTPRLLTNKSQPGIIDQLHKAMETPNGLDFLLLQKTPAQQKRFPRGGGSSAVNRGRTRDSAAVAFDDARSRNAEVPSSEEMRRIRIRTKNGPTVEVMRPASQVRLNKSQISPTHKENVETSSTTSARDRDEDMPSISMKSGRELSTKELLNKLYSS